MKTDLENGSPTPEKWTRLDIHAAKYFTDAHEWCLVDFLYFRANGSGSWICRLRHIRENTPLKRDATILATLTRLVAKGLVVKETTRKSKAESDKKHRHKYTFYKDALDKWLSANYELVDNAQLLNSTTATF